MTLSSEQVDYIVREVLRHLAAQGVTPAMRPPENERSGSVAVPPLSPPSRTLVVEDRVVTMSRLNGRLDGVSRILVAPRAIVTPLVTDELRRRGIRLERSATQAVDGASRPGDLILSGDLHQCRRALGLLGSLAIDAPIDADLERVLAQVAEARPLQTHRALVFAPAWAKILCQANRNPQLRAAAAFCPATAKQACQQVKPNVFVMDADLLSDQVLQATISEFIDMHADAKTASNSW